MIREIYRSRIHVGDERDLVVIVSGKCAECEQPCGEEHVPGCSQEQCPACSGMIIGCGCNCLCPHEAEKIIARLYAAMDSMEGALAVLESDKLNSERGHSYLVHAAMRFLFDNVPEGRRAELETAFFQQYPGLVPQLRDENGYGYYTADQLAEALNLPLEKVRMQIDAMVASGQGVKFAKGIRLKPVH